MIGKVVKPGKGFKGLIRYLLEGDRDNPSPETRVAWCDMRNMLVRDPALVPALMRATAAKSKRVKVPVYHYVISWHRDESPSPDVMRQVADTTCADLELAEHQMLFVAHDDTAHRHVHIVVNRVHPDTGIAWRTSQDYARIEQSLRRQSEAMGLDFVPGRHNDPERFQADTRLPKSPEVYRAQRQGRADASPAWTAAKVAQHRESLQAILSESHSWEQVGSALAAIGMRLVRKGQGLMIADADGDMKLSRLGKGTRLSLLEERYGRAFDPAAPVQSPRTKSSTRTTGNSHRLPPERQRELVQLLQPLFAPGFASSWQGLTGDLTRLGFTLKREGKGMVVSNGPETLNLSAFGRDAGLKALQVRFGQSWFAFRRHNRDLDDPALEERDGDRTDHPNTRVAEPSRATLVRQQAKGLLAERQAKQTAGDQRLAKPLQELLDEILAPKSEHASRPLVSARDLVFAFYGMGLLSQTDLKQSLENVAAAEAEAVHDWAHQTERRVDVAAKRRLRRRDRER